MTTTIDPLRRSGRLNIHDTHVGVWEEHVDEVAMLVVLGAVREHLRARGFAITLDPEIERHMASWSKSTKKMLTEEWRARHFAGAKHGLEFRAETMGRTIKIEFFQNINIENPAGGRYDFDKFSKMPRDMRLRCAVEMAALIRMLTAIGYSCDLAEPLPSAVLRRTEGDERRALTPLEAFNKSWSSHYPPETRGPDGWPAKLQPYDSRDRDGVMLRPGDVRWLYSRGRLTRGTVYPHAGMWWVYDATEGFFDSVNSGCLFSVSETAPLPPRRRPLSTTEQIAKVRTAWARARRAGNTRHEESSARELARLTTEPSYYVLSLKNSKESDRVLTWWRPNGSGYVYRLEHAGLYPESRIGDYTNGSGTLAIRSDIVEQYALPVADVDSREVNATVAPHERVVLFGHLRALEKRARTATHEAAA